MTSDDYTLSERILAVYSELQHWKDAERWPIEFVDGRPDFHEKRVAAINDCLIELQSAAALLKELGIE